MPQSLDNLSTTWNSAGTTYNGIRLSVTDTASAAGSNLLELRGGAAGTTTLFSISKSGTILSPTTTNRVAINTYGDTYGFGIDGSTNVIFSPVSQATLFLKSALSSTTNVLRLDNRNGGSIGFGDVSSDLIILRDAANTLAQRNSTNPQAFRIYNTYTDASNYERGKIAWSGNVLQIGTEKLGTGTARALEFQTDGVTRLTISTAGVPTFTGVIGAPAIAVSDYVGCGRVNFTARGQIQYESDGVMSIRNAATTDFGRLQFGGTTSSFPALKRDTVRLQARLADDSAFTNIQGKLTTETAYTAGAPTASGYIVLYDSTGTAYKVPAVAL